MNEPTKNLRIEKDVIKKVPIKNQGLLKRYADKAVSVITRPVSKKVELYNDPNWKNPEPVKKKGLVSRMLNTLADNAIRGTQSLKK